MPGLGALALFSFHFGLIGTCEKNKAQSASHLWYSLLYNFIKLCLAYGEDRFLEAGGKAGDLKRYHLFKSDACLSVSKHC